MLVRVMSSPVVVEAEPGRGQSSSVDSFSTDDEYFADRKLTNKCFIGYLCGIELDSHALGVSCGTSADLSITGIVCRVIAIAVTNRRLEVREVL